MRYSFSVLALASVVMFTSCGQSGSGTNATGAATANAVPVQRFTGALTRKTGTIDPVTRTELWEYDVDNRQQLLKAGAFVYARLNLERGAPSLILPSVAIATTLERKFVIRVHYGAAQWVDVRQGMTTDSGIEVFGDLHPGDTLLAKATDERKPGTTAYWKLNRK